jgi:hypothetical protein
VWLGILVSNKVHHRPGTPPKPASYPNQLATQNGMHQLSQHLTRTQVNQTCQRNKLEKLSSAVGEAGLWQGRIFGKVALNILVGFCGILPLMAASGSTFRGTTFGILVHDLVPFRSVSLPYCKRSLP